MGVVTSLISSTVEYVLNPGPPRSKPQGIKPPRLEDLAFDEAHQLALQQNAIIALLTIENHLNLKNVVRCNMKSIRDNDYTKRSHLVLQKRIKHNFQLLNLSIELARAARTEPEPEPETGDANVDAIFDQADEAVELMRTGQSGILDEELPLEVQAQLRIWKEELGVQAQ